MAKTITTSIVFFLLACGANYVAADDALTRTIQERENGWSAAYNAHDTDTLIAFYESDAILIPPGSPPVTGHEAIGDVLSSLYPLLKDLALIVDEVRPLGADHAVEIGHSTYKVAGEDGQLMPGSDNYQVVWHRGEDGVWRYVTDMFNARTADQ